MNKEKPCNIKIRWEIAANYDHTNARSQIKMPKLKMIQAKDKKIFETKL